MRAADLALTSNSKKPAPDKVAGFLPNWPEQNSRSVLYCRPCLNPNKRALWYPSVSSMFITDKCDVGILSKICQIVFELPA